LFEKWKGVRYHHKKWMPVVAMRIELAVDALELGFDRVDRDHEMLGDLRARHPRGKQPQHLQFPFRERFERCGAYSTLRRLLCRNL
jgi:hypothetical protein